MTKFLPLLFLISFISTLPGIGQSNRLALLVGVGGYPDNSGWMPLASVNDLKLIENTLVDQGFSRSNISKLTDRAATRSGILSAIRNHLVARAQPGGLVVFHFSGHGQQVCDDNGDEPDGLDEAIVPYGSSKNYQQGRNEGAQLLRDEELGWALVEVRRKLGPTGNLLVLMDACHSGTGTRGRRVARGTDVTMGSPSCLEQLPEGKNDNRRLEGGPGAGETGLAPMVALYSSGPQQMSYESPGEKGKTYGLFSYAFCQAMADLPPQTTYQSLLNRIKLEISSFTPSQTPTAEGRLNQLVLGDGIRPPKKYFGILDMIADSKMLMINAGSLLGLTSRSRVALYPPGTEDTTGVTPLAYGTIEETTPFGANLSLDREISEEAAREARVFLRERSYGDLSVSLQLDLTDKDFRKEMADALSAYPFISLKEKEAQLILEEEKGPGGKPRLVLYQDDDLILWKEEPGNSREVSRLSRFLFQPIAKYLRANYLRALETTDPSFQAEVELLVKNAMGQYDSLNNRPLKIGENVKIKISNTGQEGFYYTLLDIQPDHRINNIFPAEKLAKDFYLAPGDFIISEEEIEVSDPLGTEILKLIVTTEPLKLDLTRGGSDAPQNPLEVLLSNLLLSGSDTRGETPALPAKVGLIESLVFEIEK